MSGSLIGVGIDLVDVDELDVLLVTSDGAFLETAWTAMELGQSAGQARRLAACWAAKEATMKAIGIGLGEMDPLEVEVDMEDQRQPIVRLSGQAKTVSDQHGVTDVAISVARDRKWAIAAALACGDER
jgi:holo-[acyl-carrier protein] synthase